MPSLIHPPALSRLRTLPGYFRAGHPTPAIAIALAIAGLAFPGLLRPQQPGNTPNDARPIINPLVNRLPDKNAQMAMSQQQSKQTSFEAANVERKRQIADDSAKLLKLATDLKTEVDKTSKDTLSLGVIRKADEIEKLAHSVKEKMKLTMSGN
jgi:hypothetical protein